MRKIIILLILMTMLFLQACSQSIKNNPYLYPQCKDNSAKMQTKLTSSLIYALCNEKLESSPLVIFDKDKVQLYVYIGKAINYTTSYISDIKCETIKNNTFCNNYTTINYTTNDEIATKLKEAGLEIEIINNELKIIQGWIPVSRIQYIEKIDKVKKISPPEYASFNNQ